MRDLGKIMVVVNPHSGNRTTGKQWPGIKDYLKEQLGTFDHALTQGMGDATRITRKALHDHYDMILSVGGDGTNNEIVNGFFHERDLIRKEAVFGCISRGTGSDLIKTLRIPKTTDGAVQVILGGRRHLIDVGRMTLVDHKGKEVLRYFINIASFGMGGAVDEKVNTTSKRFVQYRNQTVTIKSDGAAARQERIVNIAVANGQYFGGGMHVAPQASMDDGLFDVVIIGDFTKREAMTQGMKIYRGTHVHHPKVAHFRAKRIEASSQERVLLDVDGEQPGRLPASFEIVPAAIQVCVPEGIPSGSLTQ
jgi:diacylglycerol kinase (ATP)